MFWQYFLTIWIIFQVFGKIYIHFNPKHNILSDFVVVCSYFFWGSAMIACLYFGGFYK